MVEEINLVSSPSGRDVDMDEDDNNEGKSSYYEESDGPSTISSEIRRRLGSLSDPGFILANRKWLEKVGLDSSHLSLVMWGYTFLIPDEEATILSASKGHFAIYKLAPDARLRISLPHFVG